MKKLFSVMLFLACSAAVHAQNDVTRFLGIPVDGTKSEMIRQLREKGFEPSEYDSETLTGEFNGTQVGIRVVTNNNKVYRIMLYDKINIDERDIQIRFNNLCRQFENNSRYISLPDNKLIPDDEDISYEMVVNNKRYEAGFWQLGTDVQDILDADAQSIAKKIVWFKIGEFRGKYYIVMFYDNEYNRANGEDL